MHKNIHFFERPFRCMPCGLAFKSKGVLEKHLRTDGHQAKVDLRKEYPLPGMSKEGEDDSTLDDDPRPYK